MRLLSNRILMVLTLIVVLSASSLCAQTNRSSAEPGATKFEIREPEGPRGGKLYITVGGRETKVFDEAFQAWIINDGRQVVFSSQDGAGGFENEGQSLRIYDVKTKRTRKILSEYVMVSALQAVKTNTGADALLVKMQDGGLGASYFAVVDPNRGEVFFRRRAELTAISSDKITLAFYRAEDWETIIAARPPQTHDSTKVISSTKVTPVKIETHDLKQVLKGRVIYNKPDSLIADTPLPKAMDVKIYLWDVNSRRDDPELAPVMRRVGAETPLQLTLDFLFAGASSEEQDKGLSSSTFGMRFEGVTLKNGTALVRFSQPTNETNYGSLGATIMAAAIEETAKQFPAVKRVVICAVGETLIDSQLEKPFAKCPK